jgi:glycine cleavage system H lipoate-binding protein
VTAVNNEVLAAPRLLNADPYDRGWLVRLAARAWEEESRALLSAADAVEAWVRAEVEAHRDRS